VLLVDEFDDGGNADATPKNLSKTPVWKAAAFYVLLYGSI
jgi:hypothetical protein